MLPSMSAVFAAGRIGTQVSLDAQPGGTGERRIRVSMPKMARIPLAARGLDIDVLPRLDPVTGEVNRVGCGAGGSCG